MAIEKTRPAPKSLPQSSQPSPGTQADDTAGDTASLLVVAFYLLSFLVVSLFCLAGSIARLWS